MTMAKVNPAPGPVAWLKNQDNLKAAADLEKGLANAPTTQGYLANIPVSLLFQFLDANGNGKVELLKSFKDVLLASTSGDYAERFTA